MYSIQSFHHKKLLKNVLYIKTVSNNTVGKRLMETRKMHSLRRRNRTASIKTSILSFPETKKYINRFGSIKNRQKQQQRNRSLSPPASLNSKVSPRQLLRRASLKLNGRWSFGHRLLVFLRIMSCWILGIVLARKTGSYFFLLPFSVFIHLCLDFLFCHGPIRRQIFIFLLLLPLPKVVFSRLVSSSSSSVEDVPIGIMLGVIAYPCWITFINAEAGLHALLISSGVAATFSMKEALITLATGYLIAPWAKRILTCFRAASYIESGKWHPLEILVARCLKNKADDLRCTALLYRQSISTLLDSPADRASDGYHPVRSSHYNSPPRPSMLIPSSISPQIQTTSLSAPTDDTSTRSNPTPLFLPIDPIVAEEMDEQPVLTPPRPLNEFPGDAAAADATVSDISEHRMHSQLDARTQILLRQHRGQQSVIANYEPPRSRSRASGLLAAL